MSAENDPDSFSSEVEPGSSEVKPAAATSAQDNNEIDDILDEGRRAVSHADSGVMKAMELEEVFPVFSADAATEEQLVLSEDSIQERILQLRNTFRYFHANVSTDINQPLVIDGDSLLIELLSHPSVSATFSQDIKLPQTLPVFFLLEKFLLQLSAGGRELHVVFVQALGSIFASSDSLLLLRKLVQQHLSFLSSQLTHHARLASSASSSASSSSAVSNEVQYSTMSVHVHFVDNWWDGALSEKLKRISPELVLVGDGEHAYSHLVKKAQQQYEEDTQQLSQLQGVTAAQDDVAESWEDEADDSSASASAATVASVPIIPTVSSASLSLSQDAPVRFAAMTMSLMLSRFKVARLTEVSIHNKNLSSFYYTLPGASQVVWSKISSLYKPAFEAQNSDSLSSAEKLSGVLESVQSLLGSSSNVRLQINAAVASILLAESDSASTLLFSKLSLVAALLLPSLPLSARAFTFSSDVQETLFDFFSATWSSYHQHLLSVVSNISSLHAENIFTSTESAARTAFTDLFDLRLICKLSALILPESSSVASVLNTDLLNKLWTLVAPASSAPFFPIGAGDDEIGALGEILADENVSLSLPDIQPLHSLKSSFMSTILPSTEEQLSSMGLIVEPFVSEASKKEEQVVATPVEEEVLDSWEDFEDDSTAAETVAEVAAPTAASDESTKAVSAAKAAALALELSSAEAKESKHWKSAVILEEETFQSAKADWKDLKNNQKYNTYMEKFSATLKGDSRFVPWEVIMGKIEAAADENNSDAAASKENESDSESEEEDTPKNKKSGAKKEKKEKKEKKSSNNAAQKIREANIETKRVEVVKKCNMWVAHATKSYNDVESAMDFLQERLLVDLPKEMGAIKKLLATMKDFVFSSALLDEPAMILTFALLDYAHKAWEGACQNATLPTVAAANSSSSTSSSNASYDLSVAFPPISQSLLAPAAPPAASTASKSSDKSDDKKSSTSKGKSKKDEEEEEEEEEEAEEDDEEAERARRKAKKALGKAGKASAKEDDKKKKTVPKKTDENAEQNFGNSMLISTSLATRGRGNVNVMDLASRVLQLISFIVRRYFESCTADHLRSLQEHLLWLGFNDTARRLAEQFVSSHGAALAAADAKNAKGAKKGAASAGSALSKVLVDPAAVSRQRGVQLFNQVVSTATLLKSAAAASISVDDLHPLDPSKLSFVRFQLQHGGSRLPRNVGSIPDDRTVKFGFWPDKWQWNLLNVVDAQQSALVIAPTSAGKSFISYYVIEKVLEENRKNEKSADNGIVVVVLPTKALVNQVSAIIYQKYGDVFGVFADSKQKHRVLSSQVLITLPAPFEILMMSPGNGDWLRRVRFVIFDEVHCIGDSDEGAIWERLLVTLPAPFVALSATVGNPQQFLDFLRRVQQQHSRDVKLITYDQRWSDLHHFIYLPAQSVQNSWNEQYQSQMNKYRAHILALQHNAQQRLDDYAVKQAQRVLDTFEGRTRQNLPFLPSREGVWSIQSQLGPSYLKSIHPCAAVAMAGGWNPILGFPADLPFAASDALSLFEAMQKIVSSSQPPLPLEVGKSIARLSPETVFDSNFLSKKDVRSYQKMLETELKSWTLVELNPDYASFSDADRANLLSATDRLFAHFVDPVQHASMDLPSSFAENMKHEVEQRFFNLLCELNASNKLPAIVFSFETVLCDHLCQYVVETLERLEYWQRFVESDPALERAKQKVLDRRRKEEHRKRDDEVNEKQEEEEARARAAMGGGDDDELPPEDDDNEIDERFSFVLKKDRMAETDLQWWLDRLHWKIPQWGKDYVLIRALKRGIGVHHERLPKPYRDLVECLFRGRHIRVVLATGTLAFGINMPCRSTVFALDSKALTPVLYRQMSGRAGRRGYDDVGNVVFFGLPAERASRLMTTSLPSLRGQFPSTTTLALRNTILYDQMDDKKRAAEKSALGNSLRLLLEHSLATYSLTPRARASFVSLLQFHFRYSLQLLVQQHLLSSSVRPIHLASFASLLHQQEPANFALINLLFSGVVRRLLLHRGDDQTLLEEQAVIDKLQPILRNALLTTEDKKLSNAEKELRKGALKFAEPLTVNLLKLLSHLVNTIPLPAIFKKDELSRSPSKVELEPLPSFVRAALHQHNHTVLRSFADMCRVLTRLQSQQSSETGYDSLPLSSLSFSPSTDDSASSLHPLVSALSSSSLVFEARSPFVAMTGRSDDFQSARDLADTVHGDLGVTSSSIPIFEMNTLRGLGLQLNAYALDFYRHQQLPVVMRDNCMRPTTAWMALKEFRFFLDKLAETLKTLSVNPEEDIVVLTAVCLAYNFGQRLEENAWSDV